MPRSAASPFDGWLLRRPPTHLPPTLPCRPLSLSRSHTGPRVQPGLPGPWWSPPLSWPLGSGCCVCPLGHTSYFEVRVLPLAAHPGTHYRLSWQRPRSRVRQKHAHTAGSSGSRLCPTPAWAPDTTPMDNTLSGGRPLWLRPSWHPSSAGAPRRCWPQPPCPGHSLPVRRPRV